MFGVVSGQQKCIGKYGKIVMALFKFALFYNFVYHMWCLSGSSIKLETPKNMWNFESDELIIAFLRSNDFSYVWQWIIFKWHSSADIPKADLSETFDRYAISDVLVAVLQQHQSTYLFKKTKTYRKVLS